MKTVEEYLRTPYHPDREYVDGEVLERNLGNAIIASYKES